jgi:surface antigen
MGARRKIISMYNPRSIAAERLQRGRKLASNRLQKSLRRKAVKKRLVRLGLVGANLVLLGGVLFFVITSSHSHTDANLSSQTTAETVAVSPVDRLTSFDVAANIAKTVNLPERTPIANQAQSARVAVVVSASDTSVAAKPQVITAGLKSWRDIAEYTVAAGENVPAVAQKFGITSESVRWSNGLSGDSVTPGTKLVVPPVSGLVYTVKTGDTPQSVATAYHTSAEKIVQDNDAENGLPVGKRILVRDGKIIPVVTRTYTNATSVYAASFSPRYGANGYDWGWCTYYAAARSGAPGNWGNANTWAYYARLSGWRVSSVPTAGAIFQTPAGWAGHVGIVEEVYDNGTMKVSDMNGFAGFGRVGYAVVSVGAYPNYISRS